MITRARHRQHVQAASEALERFDTLSRQGSMAVDMAAEELRLAASELGRITGAVDVEDVLDVLFTDFCIGK
jgi:tRNA modification GTPase